ncbi:MAG TPA: hypothetical protein VJ302_34855 [Blastocatellia bacterium]|nr:hypothetical protein [Blastocatellia bacterium]
MKKQFALSRKTMWYAGSIGGVAVLVLSALLFLPDPVEGKFKELSAHPGPRRILNETELEQAFKRRAEFKAAAGANLSLDETAYLVRKQAGPRLGTLPGQYATLEILMRDVQQRFADHWVENLHQILGAAFPGREQDLFQLSGTIYRYQKAYQDRTERLSRLSERDRQAEIWKLREEMFGSRAREIWAQEIKLKSVSEVLKQIEADRASTLETKLEMLRASWQQNFGEVPASAMQNQRQLFLDQFIRASQSNLTEMAPAGRRSALWHIRQTMGLDQDALIRWEQLDAERDRRWETGLSYMNKKQNLALQYSGPELEQKLDELRLGTFGSEAQTIKNEEAAGYLRFQRTRVLGLE